MAITPVTTTMAAGVNYTVVTDSSADWSGVASSTYFYDKTDKLVHYKDSTGTVQEIFSSGGNITVGTTPSTGTDGRVFFQAGGVVQQDANFTFDNTLKRLTLKAVNTGAGDIPFAVQNSAGTANLMQVAGDNTMTFLSSNGKIIFSQDTVGQGSVISLRRDFSNQEIIRLDGTNGGGITINPLNDGSVKSVAIGSVANGISMWTTGLNSHNFQIKSSFHNLFHVVGDPNSATATFRIGTIASNTNFFNVHGRNTGGTGLTTNPIFTINSSGTVGIGTEASTPGARLDVRAQGALSTDIAFRVRNSVDTSDLISFRGDGSQWIQSVPFIHAGSLTGTTNAAQSLHIGYNAAALNSASSNSITIGRGTGAALSGNNNVSIGNANNIGGFSSMLGIGLGVQMNAANTAFIGSETFPYSTMWVSTGGEVSSGANLRGLDFRVSGCVGGLTNQSASGVQVRFFSPNGTGSGAGSNIQFHVAPSNTGGSAFNRNIFSEMFTIRGEADGLNHYQLATPRVPSTSITDGYIQYSNDITAGNAAPHFRTENGAIVKVYQETTAVAASTLVGNAGANITDTDTFDGYTLKQIVKALRNQGLLA
jgi:hypothetical protein